MQKSEKQERVRAESGDTGRSDCRLGGVRWRLLGLSAGVPAGPVVAP